MSFTPVPPTWLTSCPLNMCVMRLFMDGFLLSTLLPLLLLLTPDDEDIDDVAEKNDDDAVAA